MKYLLTLLLLFSTTAYAVDMDIIAEIESNRNPKAISPAGARGYLQIMPITLEEWNNFHPNEQYALDDLFNMSINIKIGSWYMNVRIPQMLRYFGIEDTLENRLWAYNAGIGRVVKNIMPEETQNYYLKYKEAKDEDSHN